MKVTCELCDFKREKPQWEHLINEINKLGGSVSKDQCPYCKHKRMLTYDFTENKR